MVHVDDPLATGPEHEIEALFQYLETRMSFNRGETIGTEKFTKCLGKEYRRTSRGFLVRMPEQYYSNLIEEFGLTGSKAAKTASAADLKPSTVTNKETWEEPLSPEEHHFFRRVVGKLRFMVPERPDIGFEVLKLSKSLAKPVGRDLAAALHVVRDLNGTLVGR